MTDEQTNIPAQNATPRANMPEQDAEQNAADEAFPAADEAVPVADNALPAADEALPFSDLPMDAPAEAAAPSQPASQPQAGPPPPPPQALPEDHAYDSRLERLGGEPAPAITPEEFARLQRAGQVQIDARGRVRTARRNDSEAGVSLRKRRAWYG